LSPTGTLGNRIFPGSIDGGVSQRQANSIAVASTNHLNPYDLAGGTTDGAAMDDGSADVVNQRLRN